MRLQDRLALGSDVLYKASQDLIAAVNKEPRIARAFTAWNTPNVAHDNPSDQRFHASLILWFTDAKIQLSFVRCDTLTGNPLKVQG